MNVLEISSNVCSALVPTFSLAYDQLEVEKGISNEYAITFHANIIKRGNIVLIRLGHSWYLDSTLNVCRSVKYSNLLIDYYRKIFLLMIYTENLHVVYTYFK